MQAIILLDNDFFHTKGVIGLSKKRYKILFPILSSLSIAFATVQIGNATTPHAEGHFLAQVTITKEQAKEIALQQVKGRVIHVDLDTDNGVQKYEVIILTDQNEVYEVEINANTGKVIKVEKEND